MHKVGDKYVDAVVDGAGCMPLLIPAIGDKLAIRDLVARLDGLLLTGSPSNVDPDHYGGPPPREGNDADPDRDRTVLPLIEECLEQQVPLLGICRGIQELNVALGGTLHQHVHEVDGRFDHRSDKSLPMAERYVLRHPVRLTEGGALFWLMGEAESLQVNSLHGQAIDEVATGLEVEAVADDGTIEAVRVRAAREFALAVQWHPEWRVTEVEHHRILLSAFGDACRKRVSRLGADTGRWHEFAGAVA